MTKSVPANGRDAVEGAGGQHDQVRGRAGLEASEAGPVEQVGGDAGGADLYAIPVPLRAGIAVACERTGVYGVPAARGPAGVCFTVRTVGALRAQRARAAPRRRHRRVRRQLA
ncbi:hypothetical protein [Streptomyces antimycoticus]|uniref:hypothetical protein n=1 Tax=Streptomyces antimycoticus TaxID=68175 RepID=UPI003674B364